MAIASVYAMRPKVFVCDEPTANLDLGGIEQLLGTLFKLKAQGLHVSDRRAPSLMALSLLIGLYIWKKGGLYANTLPRSSQLCRKWNGAKGASDDAPCTNTRTATTSETFRAWVADYARPV